MSHKPHWDLLLVVTDDRYGSRLFGTIQRLIDAAIHSGRSMQIWACNASNTLTESCCAQPHPDITRWLADLLARHPDQFSWVACSTCSDDRGDTKHIDGALTEPGFGNFREYVDNAAKTVYIGGA